MTELSPAAQAIMNAYTQRTLACNRATAVGAALRTAAEHCTYFDDYGDEFISSSDLFAIAAELEGSHD